MGTFFTLVKVRLSRFISRYWVYFEVFWETRFCGKWCFNYFDLVFANGRIEWRYFLRNCRIDHPLSNATGLSSNGWVLVENGWKNELACIIVRTCTTKFRPPLVRSLGTSRGSGAMAPWAPPIIWSPGPDPTHIWCNHCRKFGTQEQQYNCSRHKLHVIKWERRSLNFLVLKF